MIKTSKTCRTAGKGTMSSHLPSTDCEVPKLRNFYCAKNTILRAGPSNTGAFLPNSVPTGACAEYRDSYWPSAVGRRKLAGRATGGGEKGARPFPCPLPAPSAGCRRRLVRGYYANCSDCGNKQGGRERRGLLIDCNFCKVSYNPKHTRQNQRESENQPAGGWTAFKRGEKGSERQRARIAIAKAF